MTTPLIKCDKTEKKADRPILIHRLDEAWARLHVSETMPSEEKCLFEKMHKAGIRFTPEQFMSLFLQGRRSGRTSLIVLRMVKQSLALKKGETSVFVVRDHREFMRNHMELRRIFISLLGLFEGFRIRRNKNVVTVTAL